MIAVCLQKLWGRGLIVKRFGILTKIPGSQRLGNASGGERMHLFLTRSCLATSLGQEGMGLLVSDPGLSAEPSRVGWEDTSQAKKT